MERHFRAFSFVDRILAVRPGERIAGVYAIPAGLESFPASLAAEAVGQLAAWATMAAVDFKSRPVAGLAATIDLLGSVRPGQVLELAAELESVDAEAVAYGGTASADGVLITRLQHCVGPMVPLEEFDDPEAVRARFGVLCGQGAEPGGFGGVPRLAAEQSGGESGKWTRARLTVPSSADFFGDHFPRRPVFPGTLLMHLNLELAARLAAELPAGAPNRRWVLREVSDVKLRAFTPPGERLEMEARLSELGTETARMTVETRNDKRLVGSARVRLAPEGCP